MNKLVTMIGLAAVSASLGMMAACSSSSSNDGSTAGGDSGAGDSSKAGDTGVTDSGSGGETSTGNPDDTCTAMATQQACGQCCIGNHNSGASTFTTATIACACHDTGVDGGAADGGSGPCATECAATLCAATPANPDATCQSCLQANISTAAGACAAYVGGQCEAVPDCVSEQTCLSGCPK